MVDVVIKLRLQFNLFECTDSIVDTLHLGGELFAVVNAIQAIANYNVNDGVGGVGVESRR